MTEINVNIGGTDYTWYRYSEPLDILNVEDINNVLHNISVLHTVLKNKGYELSDLEDITATYNVEFVKVFDVLNIVEYNLDRINVPNIISIYYGDIFRVLPSERAHDKKQIWRWFQIVEDIFEFVQGLKGKWGYLLCNDGYPTINGKKIIVRGDLIG